MSSLPSSYIKDKINDNIFKGVATGLGTNRYLALFEGDPSSGGTEASGGSYARQSIAFNASSGGTSTNSNTITFASLSSGTYDHYAIYDAATGGNLITYGTLTAEIIANSGDQVVFNANALSFSFSGS